MTAHPISIETTVYEQSAEVLEFPAAHRVETLEYQVPSPEALVASYLEAEHQDGKEELEKRRVIALLSGMVEGDPYKVFDEIAGQHEEANQLQPEKALGLGSVALQTVEA